MMVFIFFPFPFPFSFLRHTFFWSLYRILSLSPFTDVARLFRTNKGSSLSVQDVSSLIRFVYMGGCDYNIQKNTSLQSCLSPNPHAEYNAWIDPPSFYESIHGAWANCPRLHPRLFSFFFLSASFPHFLSACTILSDFTISVFFLFFFLVSFPSPWESIHWWRQRISFCFLSLFGGKIWRISQREESIQREWREKRTKQCWLYVYTFIICERFVRFLFFFLVVGIVQSGMVFSNTLTCSFLDEILTRSPDIFNCSASFLVEGQGGGVRRLLSAPCVLSSSSRTLCLQSPLTPVFDLSATLAFLIPPVPRAISVPQETFGCSSSLLSLNSTSGETLFQPWNWISQPNPPDGEVGVCLALDANSLFLRELFAEIFETSNKIS